MAQRDDVEIESRSSARGISPPTISKIEKFSVNDQSGFSNKLLNNAKVDVI